MPDVDKHADAAFSWIELGTSDQNAAKQFYTSLFGWTFDDSQMGPNDFYTMFQMEHRNAAAAYTLRGQETSMGVPPHWNLYISVASADASAQRASELGATVLAPPFDVYTYGRMAVMQDPTGAPFMIWEAKDHIGAGIEGENGSFCWADLSTADQEVAAKFYGDLFGWTFTTGEGGYLHIVNGEAFIGGIPPAAHRNPHAPPHWMIYIQTDDCDGSTVKAKELGAQIFMGPMTIEKTGRMTVLADPQGATFALFQPVARG